MGFALRCQGLPQKSLFFFAIGIFIGFAWLGQSRTALVFMVIALLFLASLTLKERRIWYWAILATSVSALVMFFPDSLEQALLRGQGLRPQIWAGVWDEAKSAPIAGHGLLSELSVEAGGKVFENAHGAYLQVLWQGGVIGLGLLFFLLVVAFRNAWSWGRQQGDYTVFCMLVFAASTMAADLDTLIGRPRDQWMLFWLPLALLLAYQGTTQRPGSIENSEIQN
jgi:O-antigen ligase